MHMCSLYRFDKPGTQGSSSNNQHKAQEIRTSTRIDHKNRAPVPNVQQIVGGSASKHLSPSSLLRQGGAPKYSDPTNVDETESGRRMYEDPQVYQCSYFS